MVLELLLVNDSRSRILGPVIVSCISANVFKAFYTIRTPVHFWLILTSCCLINIVVCMFRTCMQHIRLNQKYPFNCNDLSRRNWNNALLLRKRLGKLLRLRKTARRHFIVSFLYLYMYGRWMQRLAFVFFSFLSTTHYCLI